MDDRRPKYLNTTLLTSQIDAWEFINNYCDQSVQVFLKYQDLIENITISAQNTIEQYLPNEDVEYRLWSVAEEEYLNEWTPLPENKTVDFGFYEAEVPIEPTPFFEEAIFQWAIIIIVIALIIVSTYFFYNSIKKKIDRRKYMNYIKKQERRKMSFLQRILEDKKRGKKRKH